MDDSVQSGAPRSRRSLLAAAAGGAAALAVAAIRPAAVDAAPANMQTETNNLTSDPTGVTNSAAGELALFGHAAGDGTGVEGTSASGEGVRGVSEDTSDPATNVSNAGVVGIAGLPASIAGNIGLTGVYGYSDPSPDPSFVGAGVWGDSADIGVIGTGVVGVLGNGPFGVLGVATAADGIGVEAAVDSASARALRVAGRAEFTRSGRTVVKAGNQKKTVTLAGCTTSTLVLAVIASNRSGRWVRAAVPAAGSFTVYLNDQVGSDTNVTWIAFTNPSNHSG